MKQFFISFGWFLIIAAPFLIGTFYNEGTMCAIFGLWWVISLAIVWYSRIYKNE